MLQPGIPTKSSFCHWDQPQCVVVTATSRRRLGRTVEGVEVSNESLLLEMRAEPRRLKVRTGSEGLGTTGTLLMAVGILGVVGATAILVSGSKAPSKLDKASVLIPMYAGGAVCFGGGLAMSIAGSTKLDDAKPKAALPTRGAWLAVRGRF